MTTQLRNVRLHRGPYDGAKTICSHSTAVVAGEVYVWDGSDDEGSFIHALTAVGLLDAKTRDYERETVKDWMAFPAGEGGAQQELIIEAPPWRANAWIQLITYGQA